VKLTKMLGLAALAAVAAMALVGASSASAAEKTVLCKNETHPCTEVYPATEIEAKGKVQIQLNIFGGENAVQCDSTVKGKTTEEKGSLGEPQQLRGEITSLTFTNCVDDLGRACTYTAIQLPYQGLVSQKVEAGAQNGNMTVYERWTGVQTGQPGAEVVCQDNNIFTPDINCIYKADEANEQAAKDHKAKGGSEVGFRAINLHVVGGNPAKAIPGEQGANQKAQLKEAGGPKCPGDNPKWAGEYEVLKPKPLFISHVVQ